MTLTTQTTEHSPYGAPQPGERILHHHMADALGESALMLEAGLNANLLVVCGPTGVGKSTLGDFMVEREHEDQAQNLIANPGIVPAIRVEAPSSGARDFSWPLFLYRIADQLEGYLDIPRYAHKVDPVSNMAMSRIGLRSHSMDALRTSVERSLKHRSTRFIVVDEAAHIIRQCHPLRIAQQLDTLKSLSNECGVQWILLGSYDLFDMVMLSAQIARRSHIIHFSRYREDIDADVRMFQACIVKIQKSMPGLEGLDLVQYTSLLMKNTVGCIGTLRTVLVRLSLQIKRYGWSEQALRAALLTEAQVSQILNEIVNGEERIVPGIQRSLELPTSHTAKKRIA